jgi:hypothetical protein
MITRSITLFWMVVYASAMVLAATPVNAVTQKSAHVSQVIQDVKLLPSNASPRPAAVNDTVNESTAVRTGIQSRAELTFTDLTITRLGENTVFTLGKGTRELNLSSGSVLVQVPPKGAPVRINTAAVTAAISGGTAMFAAGPPVKFMVLEGIGTFYPIGHPEQAVTLHGGEMVMLNSNGQVSGVMTFNVKTVLETSHLIVDFPALTNLPLILDVVSQQVIQQSGGGAPNPPPSKNSVVDVVDVVSQNVTSNPSVQTFTATPSPPPPPPGPPVIASPIPYVINSGTVIATHPTITTNGVTNVGVLYRGSALDGPVSKFAFGSTSAFDIASGFDIQIEGKNSAAVFKFTSLQLTGNPTIDTTNGPIDLGLIAINGITSGAPESTMITFMGLKGVLLAAQNGSVNLGSEISFSGFHDLNIYARGASSDLTLASNIDTTNHVDLFAERDMSVSSNITAPNRFYAVAGRDMALGSTTIQAEMLTLTAFHDLSWNGETSDQTASNSDGDVLISANNNLNIANDLNFTRHNGGSGSGLNFDVSAGNDLTVQGNLTLTVDNSMGGSLDTGGNINLKAGGNLAVNGGNGLALTVQNATGTITNGGNITLALGGSLSASSLTAIINDRDGGAIGGAATLGITVGGAVVITNNFTAGTSDSNFGGGGGTMGSTAVNINAGSFSVGGAFATFVAANAVSGNPGGTITGDASNQVNVTGDLVAQGPISVSIAETAIPTNGGVGGHIGGNATVSLAGNNITTSSTATGVPGTDVMALEASIYPDVNGFVGGNAIVNVTAAQKISAPGTVFFTVANGNFMGLGPGTIGGDGKIMVSAGNLSPGALFDDIYNFGGASIGRDAAISLSVANSLTTTGDVQLAIFNSGGNITRNAGIGVTLGSLSVPSLTAEIDNSSSNAATGSPGHIGSSAAINFNVSGNATFTNNATFEFFGSSGVANGAAINFNGGNYTVVGTFLSNIDGNGAITFSNASVHADTIKVGVFGANGTLTIGGGAIDANTLLKLYAPGSNGTIDFVANVTLSNQSAAVLIAANKVTISNGKVVTIVGSGGPASVFTNIPNYTGSGGNGSTTGMFGGNKATTQPLASAPPFGIAPTSPSSGVASASTQNLSGANTSSAATGGSSGKSGDLTVAAGKTMTGAAINMSSSSQLLSLLDSAAPGPSGKITIPASKSASNSSNPNRTKTDNRLNADRGTVDTHHVRDHASNPQALASTRALAP